MFCGPVYLNKLSDITNDIGPMLPVYWKNGNGVYWIYFPKPFLDPIVPEARLKVDSESGLNFIFKFFGGVRESRSTVCKAVSINFI